ncbi:MAG: DUF362 domain-containing protein [Candidatus Hermodarchaeota archaeon]
MKSDVYFFTARSKTYKESMSKIKGPLALEKLGIKENLKKNDKVVIKTHFGALENTRYLRPSYIRFLCDFIKDFGGVPSVAESCGWGLPESISGVHTEYSGRANEEEYLQVALMHGFTQETMGAPILMLDGSYGIDFNVQPIDGNLIKEVFVAGRLREFDYMVLATHFKGHLGAGFGGALKNLGIGCVAKGQKIRAHLGTMFDYDLSKCTEDCDKCIKVCPTGALSKEIDKTLKKNWNKCRYCYMCKSICDKGVIDTGSTTTEDFIYRFVDNAKGVVDYFGKDKIFYINYAIDITWQCDCGSSDVPFIPDIGVLSSRDPVAIDQACIDLAHKSSINPNSVLSDIKTLKNNGNDWFSYIPRFDPHSGELDFNLNGKKLMNWETQLKVAEEIGLGTRNYNLIQVKIEDKR